MKGHLGNLKVTERADLPQMMAQRCCLAKRTGLGDNTGHTAGISCKCNSLQGPLLWIRDIKHTHYKTTAPIQISLQPQ